MPNQKKLAQKQHNIQTKTIKERYKINTHRDNTAHVVVVVVSGGGSSSSSSSSNNNNNPGIVLRHYMPLNYALSFGITCLPFLNLFLLAFLITVP